MIPKCLDTKQNTSKLDDPESFNISLNILLDLKRDYLTIYNKNEFMLYCSERAKFLNLNFLHFEQIIDLLPILIQKSNFSRFKGSKRLLQISLKLFDFKNSQKFFVLEPIHILKSLQPIYFKGKIAFLQENSENQLDNQTNKENEKIIYMDNKEVIIGRINNSILLFYLDHNGKKTK